MFSQSTIDEIEAVALAYDLNPDALLAVAEVESGGKAFAFVAGRKEPLIRFEGHYFDRLISPVHRRSARRAGLAAQQAGVIKNPRSQAERWALFSKAAKLDRQAAIQSVSWGIGQVMGAHWKDLGYVSPDDLMQDARQSVAGQIRLMVRFIRSKGLTSKLHARDWAGFARRYNGSGYQKNNYDLRMAAAYARHHNQRLLDGASAQKPRTEYLTMMRMNEPDAVRQMQELLREAGFLTKADGVFGVETDVALRAFQTYAHLRVDGIFGPATKSALQKKARRPSLLSWIWACVQAIPRSDIWQKVFGIS